MTLNQKINEKIDSVMGASSVQRARSMMERKSGSFLIASVSFLESFLPIPIVTDPFLVAAIILNRNQVVRLVIVTTLSSVLGGIFAFLSAAYFFDTLVTLLKPDTLSQLQTLIDSNTSNTFILTIMGAFTPIPYTSTAWFVAFIKGSLLVFIIASVIGRGLRYAIVGYCTYKFGPTAVTYTRKYIGLISVFLVVLVGIYIWLNL